MTKPVLELRVALTTEQYDELVDFYVAGLGLDVGNIWTDGEAKGTIFEMGKATLEIFNEQQAALIDNLEAGERVSGQIRFALRVPDLLPAIERMVAKGATLVHEPILTPWGHHNARLRAPDGMQITLFQILNDTDELS